MQPRVAARADHWCCLLPSTARVPVKGKTAAATCLSLSALTLFTQLVLPPCQLLFSLTAPLNTILHARELARGCNRCSKLHFSTAGFFWSAHHGISIRKTDLDANCPHVRAETPDSASARSASALACIALAAAPCALKLSNFTPLFTLHPSSRKLFLRTVPSLFSFFQLTRSCRFPPRQPWVVIFEGHAPAKRLLECVYD